MAEKIRLLTDEVIGKIAAGEVVERPAAAIKELVENSLDAGATAVTVEIRDGGITYFRVTDNGSGIQQSDIRMAFERHATSKITKAQDLSAIATLGFRGEALASIAAVGRVTCTTRTRDDDTGLRVQNEGGTITKIEEAACPEGTTFVVRDLFFNTPVRLKFLKKPTVEAGFVSDLMMRLILSRPDVSFRYISQGKTLYHSAGDGKLESAVFAIYGHEMLRNMRKVDGCEAGVVIRGYVGIGESGRGNRNHQSFFINGRYMRSGILSAAVEEACRERVMIGKFPTCVLHLTMPYELVDVNVHPNKLEVRFQNEAALLAAVEHIVLDGITDRDALERPTQMVLTPDTPAKAPVQVAVQQESGSAPQPKAGNAVGAGTKPKEETALKPGAVAASAVDVQPKAPIPSKQYIPKSVSIEHLPESQLTRTPGANVLREPAPDLSRYLYDAPTPPPPSYEAAAAEAAKSARIPPVVSAAPAASAQAKPPETKAEQVSSFLAEAPKPLRLIGTVFNTYILVEYEDHLLMIDQHAVHERLLFDRMMKLYDTQRAGQELLIPLIVNVTRREQELLEDNQELLQKLGLVVEPFGDQEVSVRSIPMLLGQPQTASFLHEVLDQLESERGTVTLEKRRAAILQTACKHAIKGGDPLDESSIRELVSRMVDEKVTPTCPHGRPLVVSLSHAELDKRFRRIQ